MERMMIQNVSVRTMDEADTRFSGWVLIEDGKIAALGDGAPPACDRSFDGAGGVLTPGLIDVHSHLGLYEDGLATRTPIRSHRTCVRSTASTRWIAVSARRSRQV